MIERIRRFLIPPLGIALALFTVYEVNYGILPPLSQLAMFAMLGMVLCFLMFPAHERLKDSAAVRAIDLLLSAATIGCCAYLVWQGTDISARAGRNTPLDYRIAIAGTLLVLEATRRSIGWALPILSGAFILYAYFGASLPDWAFFHRGYDVERIAAKCFLGSEGIFGTAMRVMFTYVFLFVVFGAFLEVSGATQFIIDFAEKIFGNSPGGPAKVSVLGSGLMGSLSGSAVANAVTTGAFTIPMMRSAGFKPHIAGGITAAAATGGALVPPVMGAGAYMMLELIDDVTFLQIAKAAVVPAVLYYLSILLIVHFYSRRVGAAPVVAAAAKRSLWQYEGLVFFGALGTLILFLLMGYTPFRAVTYSLEVILLLTIISPRIAISDASRTLSLAAFAAVTFLVALVRTQIGGWIEGSGTSAPALEFLSRLLNAQQNLRLTDWQVWADSAIPGIVLLLLLGLLHKTWRPIIREAFVKSARAGVSLVSASACVGIIIGVVTLTGVGTAFPNAVVPIAQESLLLAMIAIMVCSIILGMGLPSAVCYLLMATLIGPVLGQLGVVPLAAHLFIFYFGMMSMVTPPVALAAYASASIADANIMRTGLAAFRFALVGFTLPFMFVYRPELLLLTEKPAVTVSLAKPGEVKAGEPAEVVADLDWYGAAPDYTKLQFFPADNSHDVVTSRTGIDGSARLALAAGTWRVTAYERRKVVFQLAAGETYSLKAGERILTRDGRPLLTGNDTFLSSEELRELVGEDKVLLTKDGDAQVLGTLVIDTSRPAAAVEGAADSRLVFTDQRLSLLSVALAILTAVLGILALASGIAGYMFSTLRVWVRVLILFAAAILLSPDLEVAGMQIGTYTNIAGGALLLVTMVLNKLKTIAEQRAAADAV